MVLVTRAPLAMALVLSCAPIGLSAPTEFWDELASLHAIWNWPPPWTEIAKLGESHGICKDVVLQAYHHVQPADLDPAPGLTRGVVEIAGRHCNFFGGSQDELVSLSRSEGTSTSTVVERLIDLSPWDSEVLCGWDEGAMHGPSFPCYGWVVEQAAGARDALESVPEAWIVGIDAYFTKRRSFMLWDNTPADPGIGPIARGWTPNAREDMRRARGKSSIYKVCSGRVSGLVSAVGIEARYADGTATWRYGPPQVICRENSP